MLNKIIGAALGNRALVLVLSGVIALLGVIMLIRTEVDIFPRPECSYGSGDDRGWRSGAGGGGEISHFPA